MADELVGRGITGMVTQQESISSEDVAVVKIHAFITLLPTTRVGLTSVLL